MMDYINTVYVYCALVFTCSNYSLYECKLASFGGCTYRLKEFLLLQATYNNHVCLYDKACSLCVAVTYLDFELQHAVASSVCNT